MKKKCLIWFLMGVGCGYLFWNVAHRDLVQEALQVNGMTMMQVSDGVSKEFVENANDVKGSYGSGVAPSELTDTRHMQEEDSSAVESGKSDVLGGQERFDTTELSPRGIAKVLVELGVQPQVVDLLKSRIGEDRMALLEIRNRATREGWLDGSEYQVQLQSLSATANKIRAEFGDAVYDRYLYATERANRVVVVDVYPESAADAVGLQSGDQILRYGLNSIYSIDGLVEMTASGLDGEATLVELGRGNQLMFVTVPRGPLGVLLTAQRVRPKDALE